MTGAGPRGDKAGDLGVTQGAGPTEGVTQTRDRKVPRDLGDRNSDTGAGSRKVSVRGHRRRFGDRAGARGTRLGTLLRCWDVTGHHSGGGGYPGRTPKGHSGD